MSATTRPWARLSRLKAGDTVELDGGFTCCKAGKVTLKADDGGLLHFDCSAGGHWLAGQMEGDAVIGVWLA